MILSTTDTGSVSDLCDLPDGVHGLAWSSVLNGLVFSIPSKMEIGFVASGGGKAEVLYENSRMEDAPAGLAFTPNGETLYMEGIGKKSYMGLRIRSLSYFEALGRRGVDFLSHVKKKDSPLAVARKNGIVFFNGHL